MTVWCHLPTIFNRRYALRSAGLLALCVALIATLFFDSASYAAPGINQTLGFQGKLLQSSGAVVPDGYYNMQFKIYQDGTGTAAGNPGGALKWTETYINNGGTSGVQVKNGYFSVSLGSKNPFGTSVDWNQDTLWLSMNIAGSSASCSTFGTTPCAADGEMLPMKRISGTPYAMNAGMVGGKRADNLVQLAQGVQTDASTNTSSIFINKTGTGNLIQLQNTGIDIFAVGNKGDLTLGNNANKSISIATSPDNTAGRSLTIGAGMGGSSDAGSAGGDLVLQGGSAGGGGAVGGGTGNGHIALVVGNPSALTTAEQLIKTRLEALPVPGGVTVTPYLQTLAVPEDGTYDLIVVTEDASGSTMAGVPAYKTSTLPIVTMENGNLIPMALATDSGANSSSDDMKVITSHPISNNAPPGTMVAPFGGGSRTMRRLTIGSNFTGATPTYLYTTYGELSEYTSVFAYKTGDPGTGGFVMPGRRVFIGFNANVIPDLGTDGWTILDRAAMWAANDFTDGGGGGNGGNVKIDAGARTGNGVAGTIKIGSVNAGTIQIGSASEAITQDIKIGTNNTAGSTTNVTIGAGGSASAGTTTVQAKNSVTIATNGTTRATFSDTANTVYFGNGVSAAAPNNYTLQGTNSSATSVAGGSLTVQGGNATTGNANGGNITLAGGSGSGSGANGLVVLTTPTFSTVSNDANCYTGGAVVASSCTIAAASVNSYSAILIGFSTAGQTASLPDPTITTAGRVFYVMAAGGSQGFTLSVNGGGSGNQITMRANMATTLLWNGSDWITAGGSNSTTLQDAYNNTPQSAGSTELVLNSSANTDGLTIRDSSTSPINGTLLEVQSSSASKLFSVNSSVTNGTEHATDGIVHDATNFSTNWTAVGSASVSRNTTSGQEANDSVQVAAGTAADNGVKNKLSISPVVSTNYRASVYAKLVSGSAFTDFKIRYSPDNGSTFADCSNYSTQTVTTTGWAKISCDIATGVTAVTNPYVYFVQPTTAASARTYLVDTFSFTIAPSGTQNVKVGSGGSGGQSTLFTLDKASSAPTITDHEAMLGSMYYDTTSGKVQCYEASGWGACGAKPDYFVTISPEYTNAVMNGSDIGTITSDISSDALNINDGSSSQPTICSTNETYNFYGWTSSESTAQTRSIFITYQLPATFKNFIAGSTSLLGRTDNTNSQVTYQVYRDDSEAGLVSCGSSISVSSGAQSTWQKVTASGSADPANCGFEAGDSIFIRVNLTAQTGTNAYVSNLGFVFSNN